MKLKNKVEYTEYAAVEWTYGRVYFEEWQT